MSFQSSLTDRVNIHHLKTKPGRLEYGVQYPDEQYYDSVADSTNVPCRFSKNYSRITQEQPNAVIDESFTVYFAMSADIRLNDKIIRSDGVEFFLRTPLSPMRHHWQVEAYRKVNL